MYIGTYVYASCPFSVACMCPALKFVDEQPCATLSTEATVSLSVIIDHL